MEWPVSCLLFQRLRTRTHGLSIFGDLKYPPDFKHFAYVNPDAPKGGKVSQVGPGGTLTFDSFNNFILKGDRAQGLDLLYDTLMTRAFDEPDAVYGLVAKSADVAADGMSVVFKLRPEAKFADGSGVTADDVVFSFETLKAKGHPSYRIVLRDVEKAEAIDPQTVKFSFKGELGEASADRGGATSGAAEGLLCDAELRGNVAR